MCTINSENIENRVIFLDTSIFESENYFEGRNINILFGLAKENLIQLKITDIVYRETLNRLENHVVKAVNLFKKQKLNFDKEARILRNTDVLENYFSRVNFKESKESAKQQITDRLHQVLKECNIEIVDSSISDVKEVLEDYFSIKPPFKEGLKKSEFPDALSLNTIKKWSTQTSNSTIHLSNDKDFKGYDNDLIDCSHDLSSLLELLFIENSDIQYEFITTIYQNSIDEIVSSIEVDYSEDLSSSAFSEIENDISYEDTEVEFSSIDKTEVVIGVINEIEEDAFSYEIEVNIFFSVEAYYTDLSNAFYDKEDGIWWGEERINETKKFCANTLIYASFELDENKIDGCFYEITEFDIRYLDEV
ncbi:MAG: PIN domain-containing protein [Cyclobacteriaceae bacterium]